MRVSIKGTTFEAADRYAEGHIINAAEAAVLNQTLMENIGNNFRDTVSEWSGSPEELQAAFAEKLNAYQFGVRAARGPSVAADPVGAEAMRLAKEFIKAKLRFVGKGIKEYGAAKLNVAAEALLAKDPSFRTQAEQNVEALKSRAEEGSEDLQALLDSIPDPAPAETETNGVEQEAQPSAEDPAQETSAPRGRRARG